jgi:hypothetical protein
MGAHQPPEFLYALGFYRRPSTDGAFRYLFTLAPPPVPLDPNPVLD